MIVTRGRALGALAGLALMATAAPAAAEGFWDSVVGAFKGPQAAPKAAPAPRPAAPRRPAAGAEAPRPAQTAARGEPAKATTKAEGTKPAEANKAAASGKSAPAEPAPTRAEASRKPAAAPAASAAVLAAAGATGAIPNPGIGFIGQQAAIERANAYFNGIGTLVANFTQVGADGRKIGGKLYLSRPGRLRFEYDEPSTLEIVADGSAVAVKEKKLGTQDLYFIKDTPLKFLLRETTDLARDVNLIEVAPDPQGVRIVLEDGSTLGGTSRITLFFDPEVKTLSQWRIVDPQGYLTSVVLANVEKGKRLEAGLFVIKY